MSRRYRQGNHFCCAARQIPQPHHARVCPSQSQFVASQLRLVRAQATRVARDAKLRRKAIRGAGGITPAPRGAGEQRLATELSVLVSVTLYPSGQRGVMSKGECVPVLRRESITLLINCACVCASLCRAVPHHKQSFWCLHWTCWQWKMPTCS